MAMERSLAIPSVRNLIGDTWSEGSSEDVIEVVNPATEEVLTTFRSSTAADVDAAVRAARAAAPAWAGLTPGQRSALLHQVTDRVQAELDEMCDLEVANTGKPISAARTDEFPLVLSSLRYFADAGRSLTTQAAGTYLPQVTTMFKREPYGVVGAITPWNYPLWLAVWKTIPALITGNTVVVKPAENTPLTTTRLVEIAAEVLPPGVLNIVQGLGHTTGKALVAHPDVDLISFTGSVATGREIAQAGAARPRRSVLELGGNAPVVVLADADLADAAGTVAVMSTYNNGQECMAATRVLVDATVQTEFVELLLKAMSDIVLGDPTDEATTLGPLISARQLSRVLAMIDRRPSHAQVLTGGARVDRVGYFFEPTVISGLHQRDELVQEEIFAPVVTVQTFNEPEEGVSMANDVEFGLSGSVWTENIDMGLRLTGQLDFGNVWLNTHLAVGPDFPLGGFNESGYGKEGGVAGIEEFTRVKSIGIRTR
jgi:betaine-aldehyde dehydrogenase